MTQNTALYNCSICEENYLEKIEKTQDGVLLRYTCKRCGVYVVDHVLVGLSEKPWAEVSHLISAWIRRENKAGAFPIIAKGATLEDVSSPEWWSQKFQYLGLPETISEKLDALLLAYTDIAGLDYSKTVNPAPPHIIADIAARNMAEVNNLTYLLGELGYLRMEKAVGYIISVNGWLRAENLRRVVISGDIAFVAMWFNEITKRYREAVIASIGHCNYKPIIIDRQEYNDFIMNQVVSSIKQSRFLVADFTSRPEVEADDKASNGVRGGVYWEAGLAFGLGKPVIHTCEDSSVSRIRLHFDVNQYNTIYWKDEDLSTEIRPLDRPISNPNFAEKLAARILSTVGKGSYSSK